MPTSIDLAFAAFYTLGLLAVESFIFWPRMRPAMAANVPGARVRAYQTILVAEWLLTIFVVARWAALRRPWSDLWLTPPNGWRLVVSLALVLPMAWMVWQQSRRLARMTAARREALRPTFGPFSFMVPHTLAEHRWFQVVSVTAGICEELLFRGFLVWALRPWLGLWGAAAAAAILFGLGHTYLGRAGFTRATIAGVVFGLIALITGSLVPGIILHALADLQSGMVGWAAFREDVAAATAQPPLHPASSVI